MNVKTIEVDKVIELRDHYLREAKRCDDAIALYREIGRLSARADAITGKVRKRVNLSVKDRKAQIREFLAGQGEVKSSEIAAVLGFSLSRAQALLNGMPDVVRSGKSRTSRYRLRGMREGKSKAKRPGTGVSARHRAAAAAGTRPIDTVRRLLAADPSITRERLLQESGFIGTITGGPPNMNAEGRARRQLGLAISVLLRNREIKTAGDGFTVRKLRPADANGAEASPS